MANHKILAVIPARGGSKGIPRKNIRLLCGKPLISYSILASLQSKYITDVVVSTDDDEIAEISRIYGAQVIKRPDELAQDDVPLDPVIYHSLNLIEKSNCCNYDLVVTIQPTSPLLKTETIDKAIEFMLHNDYDTLISVKPEPHLYWTKINGSFKPLYKERKNRQYLDPIYKETGSILISKRNIISENNRIGDKLYLFEIPTDESHDIDTYQDWVLVETQLNKKCIIFRVDADPEMGLGHVYRALTLASRMAFNSSVFFLMNKSKKLGIAKIEKSHFPLIVFDDDTNLYEKIKQLNPDIIINDILDTDKDYILKLKGMGYFVVNFEDLGDGGNFADIVINSLYENSYPPQNHYYGYKYVCLRDEFYMLPCKQIIKDVQTILVTYGGTDPNNLTLKSLKAIEHLDLKKIRVVVILGLGYGSQNELQAYVDTLIKKGFEISIKNNISMMAREIYDADIVLTSNGRTIYEITSIGTPFISISQNERESRHLFVHYLQNNMNLGMAYSITEDDIAASIKKYIDNYDLRVEISNKLLQTDLKTGIDRTLKLIYENYHEWEVNEKI